MTSTKYLGLRLFLEGVEVDVVQATVRGGIGSPVQAQVVIPASVTGMGLHPRTLVHLFALESGAHHAETAGAEHDPNLRRNLDVLDPRQWSLIFVGELRGFSYSKVGGQRTVALSCSDLSSYWDSAKIYWGTGNTSFNSVKQAIYAGAQQLKVAGKKVSSSGDLIKILTAAPASNPRLPGLLGGVVALLESATGVFDAPPGKNFRGSSPFLSQAELRLHLTRLIAASPQDDSSAVFFRSYAFRRYLSQVSQAVKSTSSIMDLVQLLLSKTYHQFVGVPAPPLVAPYGDETRTKVVRPTGVRFSGNDAVSRLLADVLEANRLVDRRFGETVEHRTAEGARKRSDLKRIGYGDADPFAMVADRDTLRRDTSKHLAFAADVRRLGLSKRGDTILKMAADLRNEVLAKAPGAAQISKMERTCEGIAAADDLRRVLQKIAGKSSAGGAEYPGHNEANFVLANRYGREAQSKLGKVPSPTKIVDATVATASRLNAFLLTPDLYMAVPPKCNVLFPDQVQEINYGQDFFSETTRMWLHSRTNSGVDRRDVYFSPNTSIHGGPKATDTEAAVKKGVSFLMNHELFTGIISEIQGLGDTDLFKKIHTKGVAADKASGGDGSNVAGQALHSPQEHLQRAANYLFFSSRYSSRNIRVTCRFSPQLVVGLPAVVLDPVVGDPSASTHFVGCISSVEHVFHASGGAQTVVSLSKCRRHLEGVGLFGGQDTGVVGETSVTKVKILHKSAKSKAALNISRPSPFSSEPEVVDGFTVKFKPDKRTAAGVLPPKIDPHDLSTVDGFVPEPGKKYEVRVRTDFKDDVVNTDLSKGVSLRSNFDPMKRSIDPASLVRYPDAGKDVGVEARESGAARGTWRIMGAHSPVEGDTSHRVYVDIYEIRKTKGRRNVKFAFEDTASPPWHAAVYRPAAIGPEFYAPTLGCTSIVDPTDAVIGSPVNQAPEGSTSITKEFPTESGSASKTVQIPEALLSSPRTVAEACEALSSAWLQLREAGADMDLFVTTYTSRSFASLYHMLGNKNPYLRTDPRYSGGPRLPEIEGFHGAAFGRYSNLAGLDGERLDLEPLTGGPERGELEHVDGRADQRLARYERVEAHRAEIDLHARRTNRPEGFRDGTGS